MCQAIPKQVLQVEGDRAEILDEGRAVWVQVHDMPGLCAGEYLIVYAGQALERMPAEEAETLLASIDDMDRYFQEAMGQ